MCFRNLELYGLNASGILMVINRVVSGTNGREDCTSCSNEPPFTPLPNMDYCNLIGNITENLKCVLMELGNLRCSQYISDCLEPVLDCLGEIVRSLPKDETDPTKCQDIVEEVGRILQNIGDVLEGKICTIGI
ncbi:uncharacterized protein [Centruroides vittatus]|uniref:uncharacterized protein n=1 Tax=Centruroides vittatus TaxID=120091 RepID=UPI0035109CE1